jgi:hypothetical protein
MYRYLLLFFIFFTLQGKAQTVEFNIDADCKAKLDAYNAALKAENQVKVYRIQYAVLSDRMAMESEMKKFTKAFPLFTDWHQKGPYYYLKAGAYLSKLDAFGDMLAINKIYPGAIYIVESVKKRRLL